MGYKFNTLSLSFHTNNICVFKDCKCQFLTRSIGFVSSDLTIRINAGPVPLTLGLLGNKELVRIRS